MPATKKSVRSSVTLPAISILKTSSCPTLSGSSNLQYQLGKDDTGTLHLRISGSDGGGFFSQEWVAWTDVQKALAAAEPITSVLLRPLLTGQSVNTCGFLLAALLKEKVVERIPEKTKLFRLTDPAAFLDKVSKLQPGKPEKASGATPKKKPVDTPAKAPAKKSTKSSAKPATK
jgi:hypothetical protein